MRSKFVLISLCVLLGLVMIQGATITTDHDEITKLVASFLEAHPNNGTGSGLKQPLEEVLELFQKLIDSLKEELKSLNSAHESNSARMNTELGILERQRDAEVKKCSSVDKVISSLTEQIHDSQDKIKSNEKQIKTNLDNIDFTLSTQCQMGHDFFYSLKSYREGIDLLTFVRKLIVDKWQQQSKSTSLLEDHTLSQMVSGLLPKMAQMSFIQNDPQFKDILDFVKTELPMLNHQTEHQVLIEESQPNLRLKSFDTAFGSTSGQIEILLKTIDRVIERNKVGMEKSVVLSIDKTIATDRYVAQLRDENAKMAEENKLLNESIVKLTRQLEFAQSEKKNCATSVVNAEELVEEAKFNIETENQEYERRKKQLEDDAKGIQDLILMYKKGVYESSIVKSRVEEELRNQTGKQNQTNTTSNNTTNQTTNTTNNTSKTDQKNATSNATSNATTPTNASSNTSAASNKTTPTAPTEPAKTVPTFLIDAVSCNVDEQNSRKGCSTVADQFMPYVNGDCLTIKKSNDVAANYAYIYYQVKDRIYTAVYDKAAVSDLFQVGHCPCNDKCDPNQLTFLDSSYSMEESNGQETKTLTTPITNKLNSFVKGNTLHLVQPKWRSLLPRKTKESGRDFEITMNYAFDNVNYAIQTADTIPLGIGTVPASNKMKVSRGIMACDAGSYEVLSQRQINTYVQGGSYLELCYDELIKAKEDRTKCSGEKRLCFEFAYQGLAHTACVKPNYCFRFGKAQ